MLTRDEIEKRLAAYEEEYGGEHGVITTDPAALGEWRALRTAAQLADWLALITYPYTWPGPGCSKAFGEARSWLRKSNPQVEVET